MPSLSATAATAAAAAATRSSLPPPPLPLSNLQSSTAKERGIRSTTTSVPMAAPTWKHLQVQTIGLIQLLSAAFEVCDVGQGDSAISKLVALNCFAIYILQDVLRFVFGRLWGGLSAQKGGHAPLLQREMGPCQIFDTGIPTNRIEWDLITTWR